MAQLLLSALIFVFSLSTYADFHFFAVGDTGKGGAPQFKVGETLAKDCVAVDCEFSLLLGDNVYDEGITSAKDPKMIEVFEKPYKDFPKAFYAILGNHDYGKLARDWKRGQAQLDYAKTQPKLQLPNFYYYFEFENVLFVMLDTSSLFHGVNIRDKRAMIEEALKK